MKRFFTFGIFIAVLLTCTASRLFSLDSERQIILTDRDRWDNGERNLVEYPISAIIKGEHSIVIDFLQEHNNYVTIQILDNAENIIFTNTYVPNHQILIDITSLNSGEYQLTYSSPERKLCGSFYVF